MKIDEVVHLPPKGRDSLVQEWFSFKAGEEEAVVCILMGSPKLEVRLGGQRRLIDAEALAKRVVEMIWEDTA